MKTKKFLAILLSLVMLVGLLPMAGMLASAAEASDGSRAYNEVYFFEFSKYDWEEYDYEGVVTTRMQGSFKLPENAQVTVSFDYCVTNDGGFAAIRNHESYVYGANLKDAWVLSNTDYNTYEVTAGEKGKATATFTASAQDATNPFALDFAADGSGVKKGADLYIWNFSVIADGVELVQTNDDFNASANAGKNGVGFTYEKTTADVDTAALTAGQYMPPSDGVGDDDSAFVDDDVAAEDDSATSDSSTAGDAAVADDSSSVTGIVIGVVAALVLAIAVVVFIVLKKRAA